MSFAEQVAALASRNDLPSLLDSCNNEGIELGVAEGWFAERLLQSGKFAMLYGIDSYGGDRRHDVEQYRRAYQRMLPHRSIYQLLRMKFNEAVPLFDDGYFDFIYIDGYAHNGNKGGKTYKQWYPKLRSGGIMAGDDYEEKYSLVQEAVDAFALEHNLEVHIIKGYTGENWASKSANWLIRKP